MSRAAAAAVGEGGEDGDGERVPRFSATVLRRYAPNTREPLEIILGLLEQREPLDGDEQDSFDAAMTALPSAFYMELVDRATRFCLSVVVIGIAGEVRRITRRTACLLRAMNIDDDPAVWYYIVYGAFAALVSELCDYYRTAPAVAPMADTCQRIVHDTDQVSRHLIDGVFRACMRNPERCMPAHRCSWIELMHALEVQQAEEKTGIDDETIAERAELRRLETPADRTRREENETAYGRRVVPFIHFDELMGFQDAVLGVGATDVQVAAAWDAPFVRQAAANTRNALHAQNTLGLPGRTNHAQARLPSDMATHVASFLAPARVPVSDLMHQQAAYTSSVDRNRARTDLDRAVAAVEVARQRQHDAEERNAQRQRVSWLQGLALRGVEAASVSQSERDRTHAAAAAAAAALADEVGDEDEEEEEEKEAGGGAVHW